jgi:hypothetical protein
MTSAATAAVDLAAIESGIQAQITELDAERAQLSLDAFSDKRAKALLDDVEDRLAAAQAELGRVQLARAEQERRVTEARETETRERQAAALNEARRLQGLRAKLAAAVDDATRAYLEAVAAYIVVCRKQERQLIEGGWSRENADTARPRGHAIEAAFAVAKRQVEPAGVFGGIGLWQQAPPSVPPSRQAPLAESDARPVEPLED